MNKLVIITTRFPYFNTEAFLETEYIYTKKEFEQIVFLPLYKGEIRENCKDANVCDSYCLKYAHLKQYCLKVLFKKGLYASLWRHKSKILQRGRLINTFKQETHLLILKEVVSENIDLFSHDTIIYSYWFNAPVYALLRIRELQDLNFKVVCRAHRFDVYDEQGEMPNRSYCLRMIDRVFAISQDAINILSNKYGYKKKFTLSRLGVKDFDVLAKTSPENCYHIVSVSQVHPRKRIKELQESIVMFARKHHNCKIIWTHFGDGPLLNQLKSWSDSNKKKNLEIHVMGRVPNNKVLRFYMENPVDVFINISSSEGVPVSIMEALSFGIPTIATNVGGSSEIVNKKNGVLLQESPTLDEVVAALDYVQKRKFNRTLIKENWFITSNAEANYSSFIKQLKKI